MQSIGFRDHLPTIRHHHVFKNVERWFPRSDEGLCTSVKLHAVLAPVFEAQTPTAKIFQQLRSDGIRGFTVMNEIMVKAQTRGIFIWLKAQHMSGKL